MSSYALGRWRGEIRGFSGEIGLILAVIGKRVKKNGFYDETGD